MILHKGLRVITCEKGEKSCFSRPWLEWESDRNPYSIREAQTISTTEMPAFTLSNFPVNVMQDLQNVSFYFRFHWTQGTYRTITIWNIYVFKINYKVLIVFWKRMGEGGLGLPNTDPLVLEGVFSRKCGATLNFKNMGDPSRNFFAFTKAEYHSRKRLVVQFL